MGVKKQRLQEEAKTALKSGVLSILQDSSKEDRLRLRVASNVLHNVSCPADVCREAVTWLLRRCHDDGQQDEAAATVVAECLSSPGVLLLLEEDSDLLVTLLSAAVSGHGAKHRQLFLNGLSVDAVMTAAAVAAKAVTASPDDRKTALVFTRLCDVLSGTAVVRLGTGSARRQAYLRHLLVPSLRVSASRPDLTSAGAAAFSTLALTDGDVPGRLMALAAGSEPPAPEAEQEVTQLLAALYNLSATDAVVGAEMMALLGSALLRGSQPLLAVALLASRAGFLPPAPSSGEGQPEEDGSAGAGAPLLAVPSLKPETPPLPLETRLKLLSRLCVCVRDLRLSLTASCKQVTLLQWLRAAAAQLLTPQFPRSAAWFDCLVQLLRVSPLVLPLHSRLGPLLLVALEAVGDLKAAAGAAAGQLLQLVLVTYADLHQLPKLLPQLLLSARSSSRLLRLGGSEMQLLAEKLSLMPQAHIPQLWKTLLYHLTEDVLKTVEKDSGRSSVPSSAAALTFQLAACFLGHAAVIDQTTTTAATRYLLAPHMTQTCDLLSQVAALVAESHTSPGYVAGLLPVCIAWRQLHTALEQYCEEYQKAETPPRDPYCPLTADIWQQLTQLPAAAEREVRQLLQQMRTEMCRNAPDIADIPAVLASGIVTPAAGSGVADQLAKIAELEHRLSQDAEDHRLHIEAVSELASAVAALTRDTGREGARLAELARSIRDAAASALKNHDADDLEPCEVVGETVLAALSDAGAMLESHVSLLVDAAYARPVCAALKVLLKLPLESMSAPRGSELMTLLCLCLMMKIEGGEVQKNRKRRNSSGGDASTKKKKKKKRSLEATAMNTVDPDETLEIVTADGANALTTDVSKSSPRHLVLSALPALLYSFRQNASSLDALRSLQPCRLLSWLRHVQMTSHSAGDVTQLSDVTQAVLAVCSGRIVSELADYAEALVNDVDQGKLALKDAGVLVELLQHYVKVNDELKGADAGVKQQAKALAACLPRLLSAEHTSVTSLSPWVTSWLFSGWELLVRLRGHKPSSGPVRPLWRRQLSEVYPIALQFAVREGHPAKISGGQASDQTVADEDGDARAVVSTEMSAGVAGEVVSRTDTTAPAVGCAEAWSLLRTVCSHRPLLSSDLPSTLVEDVWLCLNTAPVAPTLEVAMAVLSSADDAQLEQMLVELEKNTVKLCVEASDSWERPLLLWRALAEIVLPEDDAKRRHRQRQGLQWALTHIGHTLARQQNPLVSSAIDAQFQPSLNTISAIVRQKGVRISDVALAAGLLACRPQFCSSAPSDQVALVLRNVATLLEKLCDAPRSFVVNRVPLFTQAIAYVFQQTCARSLLSDGHEVALLSACNGAGRALRQLCRLGSHVEPTAPQLAADLLQLLAAADVPLPAGVQESVTRSVYALLALCRDEAVTRLRVTVPLAVRPLLHSAITGYKRYYKFAGRV